MMKQQFKCCVWLILMLLGGVQMANAAFKDFSVIVNNQTGTLLTSEEQVEGTSVSFGVAVDGQGAVSRVETSDASSVATVTGTYHSDHGCTGLQVVVPVEGDVKITVGQCTYSTNTITVKNSNNETVVSKSPSSPACWKNDHANVDELYYSGPATTLTISGMGYCPYVAVEAVQSVPQTYTISYSLGSETATGVLPVEGEISVGDTYTVPKNFTLYKEGYTLTGWTDGTNTYNVNSTITPESDLALTPVFTQNTVSLADRTDAVTLKWDFQRNNGAPTLNYGSNATGVYVTQAVVNGSTIDVKLDFNTGGSGKIANANWGDWCQMNNGTTYTIPSCKDAVVSVEAFNALGTGDSPLTIDGQSDYTSAKTVSYTIANTSNTIDVVIGSEGSYYRYIQTVLPVVEQSGGTSYTNEAATVTWPMDTPAQYTNNTVSPDGVFSTVGVELGDVRLMDQDGNENATGTSTVSSGITFSHMRPTNNGNDYVTWTVKPVAGLTFTPTKISAYIVRFGTNAENGVTFSAKVGDGSATTLGTYTAPRNNKSQADDTYGSNANYAVNGLVEITLTAEQQAAFTSVEGFSLMGTIGVGNAKTGGIAQVKIEGLINGTAADVNKYTLTVVPSDAAAGTVTAYPAAVEYEEGASVKLTATPNFGYHFVNWTDGENNVLSTDAVYNHEMTADIAITANFEAVQTYELALTVDGTNDYMVTVDPAPTVVDGKNMYETGTTVVLTANQYEGLVTFNNWSDGTTNSEKTITMDSDQEITAVYSQGDIIAGWDFYKAGNSGRVADFAATDNDADALQLINTETGATSGWLDKSTLAPGGGYESFKGAAVNWRTGSENGDVGNWHWQTKVNAEAFQNINVQFQMMYNYNAYKVYDAEYSLDGENWTNFGSITMTGAKAAASFSEQLPAACNNQSSLYIRMIADKNSDVDGTASKNDGNTLAMFFITGTEQLADDPVAPALVSSVPAEGATNASATGKIVLTFDKKVQVVEGTTATLGTTTLTPTVSGKTITFSYKNLDYATPYTFSLPANTVQNLTGATLTDAITVNFTTMTRPTVTKGLYDAVVSNVDELVAAIAEAEARADENVRYRIFLKNGEYMLPQGTTDVTHTVTLKDKSSASFVRKDVITYLKSGNISLVGESRDGVVITNTIPADDTFEGEYGTASVYEGIGSSDVLQLSGSGYYFQDVTVSTGMEDGRGRDIAIQDKATKTIYKNVKLHGYQDTWRSIKGLYYFEGGVIRGRTDFLCGGGDAFFNGVDVVMCESGGFIVAPQGNNHYGYVFKDCTIKGEQSGVNGNYYLGRAWTAEAETYFINTLMEAVPTARGWSDWSNGPTRFAEYNSRTATGTEVDLDSRATSINGTSNEPKLSAEEADMIGEMSNSFGDWQPTLDTEQAPVPTDVELNGTTLSWTGSDYALLYAICKDGSVVDFTTDATFEVDDPTATWTIRAANEMGGLSEASVEAVSVDLVLDETGGNSDKIEAANGQTVNVKVERTLSSQYYNTLFLPFAMTAEQIKAAFGEGVQVATFTGMLNNSSTTFGFTNVTAMAANTGYLVKPAAAVDGFTVEGVTITSEASVTPSSDWVMYGSYDTFAYSASNEVYYFTTGGTVKKLASGSIKGLRAFMMKEATEETVKAVNTNVNLTYGGGSNVPSQARADFFLFLDGGTTTGINSIENGQIDNDAPAYNLAGQKVGKGYKGIVIINGKKVVK